MTVGFGADVALWENRRVQLSALPQVLVAHATSTVRGVSSGNALGAEKTQVGFSAGLETRVTPAPRVPVSIVAGGAFRRLGAATTELVADGYTPFENWYSVRVLYAGVAVSLARTR